jgi:hypothetical protein
MGCFLADLSRLRASGNGEPLTPEAFQASLARGLAERGYNLEKLVELERQLFFNKPKAYAHLVSHLDALPGNACVEGYVRAADALMTLQGLMQSVA